jgi:hypothetical protein
MQQHKPALEKLSWDMWRQDEGRQFVLWPLFMQLDSQVLIKNSASNGFLMQQWATNSI